MRTITVEGLLGGLILAQIVISGSWDGVRRGAPCSALSLLVPLPLHPTPTFIRVLSHKERKKKEGTREGILKK